MQNELSKMVKELGANVTPELLIKMNDELREIQDPKKYDEIDKLRSALLACYEYNQHIDLANYNKRIAL